MNRQLNLSEVDERLREWGYFFRDRRQLSHCRSIEHRFRRRSDDADPDGWGDMESAPKTQPRASYFLDRALITHEAVQQLPKLNKWVVTYAFAYPGLPKFVVLRALKKWTGRRLNWKGYEEALDIGRCRVYTTILSSSRLTQNFVSA
jgi:hypothetical protein